MFNKKILWIIGTGAAIAAAYGAYWFFPRAFPIVSVSITMDRSAALDHAKMLASDLKLGPQEQFTQAAVFDHDNQMQVYTELEAGGVATFQEVIQSGKYSPYYWVVRHFKPFEINEVYFYFTPDGKIYGFEEIIAETQVGPSLEESKARVIAEENATKKWAVPLEQFSRVESSKDTKPNGRTDHTFVYERAEKLKDAFYRVTLTVTGDKLTGVHYSVKIPETFTKQYQQMRSANNTLASGAFFAMLFLYVIIIGLSSLMIFFRKRWLLWKPALYLGLFISFLMVALRLNELPILWMQYKTTVSFTTFLISFMLQAFVGFLINALIFTYVISLAEGLTRIAFGNRLQFWSLWKTKIASTQAIAGQTALAYILLPLFIFCQVLIFMVARYYLGWWWPATTMINPNVIATYFPWLETTGIAIEAGIIEECLFRAVPLAAAAWLGKRYNKQTLFVAVAFVVQCLIFGAAHANYPAQPAYARLIELIFMSSIFGGIYLRFGLLPGILAHSLFDFTLGAIPLFLMVGHGALLNKIIIVLLGLIPAAIVIVARIRAGSWHKVPAEFYNGAWAPTAPKQEPKKKNEEKISAFAVKQWRFYVSLAIGIVGLALFVGFAKFKTDGRAITHSISDIKKEAKKLIAQKGIILDDSWTTLAIPATTITDEHRFIWQQKDGKKLYKELDDNFLPCPGWSVRFVRFNGTVQERAESYSMRLGGHDFIKALSHHVIAEVPGASLSEEAARNVALAAAKSEFNVTPEMLQEISAQAAKQPARTDWSFNFKEKAIQLPQEAEARIGIDLIGDSASGYSKYVHIPEQWERDWKSEQSIHQIINMVCTLLMFILLTLAIFFCWRRFGISPAITKQYLIILILILIGYSFLTWCSWDTVAYYFNAQEPYYHQLFRTIGGMLMSLLFMAAAGAGFIVASLQVKRSLLSASRTKLITMAVSLGVGITGIIALLRAFEPSRAPFWGNYSYLTSSRPWTFVWLSTTFQFAIMAAGLILLLNLLYEIERSRRWGKLMVIIGIPVLAVIALGAMEIVTIPFWIFSGLIIGLCLLVLYYLLLCYCVAAAPVVVGAFAIMGAIQYAVQGLFHDVILVMTFAGVVIAQLAWGWFSAQSRE